MFKIAPLFLVLSLLMNMSSAKASLLIEPLVGFSFGGAYDFDGGESYSGISGTSYGGRLGFQKLGFQLGLDYLHTNFRMEDDDFGNSAIAEEFAGFVGFQFPILLRVYAGYIFAGTAETKYNDQDTIFRKGNGGKVGVGITPLPFITVNVEFRAGNYNEWKQLDIVSEDKIKFRAWMLSLSIPINL